jgi:hypothetical protein
MRITDFTFPTLKVMPIGKNLFMLAGDCEVTINQPCGKGYVFTLKKGFVTDLGSVPNFLSGFIPQHGDQDLTVSYCIHDALYTRIGATLETAKHLDKKEFADDLLKAMLANCDETTNFQISQFQEANKTCPKECKKYNDHQIKLLKGQLLGNAKIWAIWKAVAWFGKSAYNSPEKPPYDKNFDKVIMEVL